MAAAQMEFYIRVLLHVLIFLFGITGNLFTMFFFGFKMKRAASFRWFVIHLAIADCTYATMTPLMLFYLILTDYKWRLGVVLCKTMTVVGQVTVNVSAWILCCMTYERYRAVCHPFELRFSLKRIHITVAVIWLISFALKIPVILRQDVNESEYCFSGYKHHEATALALVFLLTESVMPIILLFYYIGRIVFTLRERKKDNNINNSSPKQQNRLRKQNRNAVNTIVQSFYVEPNADKVKFAFHRANLYPNHLSNNAKSSIRSTITSNMEGSSTQEQLDVNIRKTVNSIDDIKFRLYRAISYLDHYDNNSENNIERSTHHHKHLSIKNNITSLLSHCSSHSSLKRKDKHEHAIIGALFLSVSLFIVSSLPFNLFYFVVQYLYEYQFTIQDYNRYNTGLLVANDWLGLLVLSGSILNVFVYAGKFPKFRYQLYLWFHSFRKNITGSSEEIQRTDTVSIVVTEHDH